MAGEATGDDVQRWADAICSEWGVDPIRVEVNGRLSSTGGRFRWRVYSGQRWIEVARWALSAAHDDLLDVVRHEVAHYFAHVYHGPIMRERREAHGPRWQEWALALGARPVPYYPASMNAVRRQAKGR